MSLPGQPSMSSQRSALQPIRQETSAAPTSMAHDLSYETQDHTAATVVHSLLANGRNQILYQHSVRSLLVRKDILRYASYPLDSRHP